MKKLLKRIVLRYKINAHELQRKQLLNEWASVEGDTHTHNQLVSVVARIAELTRELEAL